MSLEKLKLSKQLVSAMTDLGYLAPKEIQSKCISRIIGGQDLIAIGPDGCGKTTTYILSVLAKLKYSTDEAPKVLILVPDQDKVLAVIDQFKTLSGNRNLRIIGMYGTGGMEDQILELLDGVDIVVSTPTRARAVYLKLGLNLNRLQMFIVDDAEIIVKQGMQLPVFELARSAGKCQHLVFTTVYHDKLEAMIGEFLNLPVTIEVDELGSQSTTTHELLLYQVPNFKTKITLLNELLRDSEVFNKVVVFVNSRLTAQKLSQQLSFRNGEVAVLNPLFFDEAGFDHIEDFKSVDEVRVLIVANEGAPADLDLSGIPFLFHFEVPEQKETFLGRIVQSGEEDVVAITFATDLELPDVRKIEQSIGFRIERMELPEGLAVEPTKKATKKLSKQDDDLPAGGGAFHDKKESNSKNFNYGIGQKAKMNMKKKHG